MDAQLIDFILTHENEDVAKLLLKHKELYGHPISFVANQINGRKRAKEKLPAWYSNVQIAYPPQQKLEQCSSESTAKYRCEIIDKLIKSKGEKANTIADLTGGFGVDSYFFSKLFNTVFHVEPNAELNKIASDNHNLLRATNIEHAIASAEEFLESTNKFDWLYLDPSRKNKGRKVVLLSESEPDVVKLLPVLFSHADNIMIKTSPLLDIKEGIKQLEGVNQVFVVSVNNECKEVLFCLEKVFDNEPKINCINLPFPDQSFHFTYSEEASIQLTHNDARQYVYEPNASILKAGAFKSMAKLNSISKISTSTHLYTSDTIDENFPGRIFKIKGDIKDQKQLLPESKANIISRNHPLSVEEIKKKFKLRDGGDKYVLAFSGVNKKSILIADRLK